MMADSTVEEKAERLALLVADRATSLAVERAVRDTNVDRDLRDHDRHLQEIDGSQRSLAASVAALEKLVQRMTTAAEALGGYVSEQSSRRFSKWTLWFGVFAAAATWVAIIVTLATSARF